MKKDVVNPRCESTNSPGELRSALVEEGGTTFELPGRQDHNGGAQSSPKVTHPHPLVAIDLESSSRLVLTHHGGTRGDHPTAEN